MAERHPSSLPKEHQDEHPGKEHEMQLKPRTIRPDYKGSGKLEGKCALITGGDSGIGRSIATHFAREGADVAIAYLDEHEDAEQTKKEVEAEGQRCVTMAGDVKDAGFCRSAVEQTVAELGGLNVLVSNAAVQYMQTDIRDITPEQLQETFHTNALAPFYLVQAALDHLSEGDCIINTTSVVAFKGNPALLDYSATKGAVLAFTRALAQNLAEDGIRVNAVAPGPIWTPFIPSTFPADQVETFGQNTPLGRAGQPEELGPAYVYLASQDASYVTGQTIHVNGGKVVGG